jgi:hypothetical protein
VTKISSGEGDKRQFSRRKICEGNIFRKWRVWFLRERQGIEHLVLVPPPPVESLVENAYPPLLLAEYCFSLRDLLVPWRQPNSWRFGGPVFVAHIRALFEIFDSKLADSGKPVFRQLGSHLYMKLPAVLTTKRGEKSTG